MSGAGYLTALVLAGLFAWAGAAKLADRRATADTFSAFGLPRPDLLARAVPAGELALAVVLVVAPAVGAVAALFALAALSAVLVRALHAGVEVGCGCFGSAKREPAGTVELVRNGLMAAAAAFVVAVPGPAAPGLDAVVLVTTAVAVACVVLALADLGRRTGHILRVDLAPGPGPDGGVG